MIHPRRPFPRTEVVRPGLIDVVMASTIHSALQIRLPDDRFVIECAAILNLRGEERGVVAGGPVGMSWLGRFRHFRYEIRRWRGGSISDLAHAVSGPVRVATDIVRAQRVLDLAPSVPTPVWGRDELRTGEMWNSNSLISWLLARAGIDTDGLEPSRRRPSSRLERRSGGGGTPDATPNTLKSEAGMHPPPPTPCRSSWAIPYPNPTPG